MDIYNYQIYPRDNYAKKAISKKVEIGNISYVILCNDRKASHTDEKTYLRYVQKALDEAFVEFKPELIIYNAGTDILENGKCI